MNFNWKLKFALIALVIAVMLVVTGGKDAFNFMKDPIQLKTSEQVKNLKNGDHVTFDITMVYDCIISQTTTTTKNGVTQSSKESARYYVIPFLDINEAGYETVGALLTIKVNSEYFSKFQKAGEDFWNYWEDYTLPTPSTVIYSVDGIIKDMSSEEQKYASDYVKTGNMRNIYVNTPSKSASYIMLGGSGVALLLGALFIVLFVLGKKKEQARLEEMRANNPTYYQAPAGVTFNNNVNDPTAQNPYAFDPSTDPRFNGMAQGNPVAPDNQYNAQPMNGNFNEVAPTNGQYSAPADNSGNFNEIPNNDPFNNQQ